MRRRFSLLPVLSAILLAGCAAHPTSGPPPATPVDARPHPTAAPPPATLVAVEDLPPVVPAPPEAQQTNSDWIPLEAWSSLNGFGVPAGTGNGPQQTVQWSSPRGPLTLWTGQQRLLWDELTCLLAYPPRWTNRQVLVHQLDALKTLQPLLDGGGWAPPTNRVITLDPGHGGQNAGTRSIVGNSHEKEFTLDWALRLRPLLEDQGWIVHLTRTNDIAVSLEDRALRADQHRSGLFLSLHFNSAFPRQELAGLETYCLTPAGLPSNLVREFADDPRLTFPNNGFDEANFRLALQIHRALVRATGRPDRGVRRARFMTVLRLQSRPAALIEGGYLSNPDEARLIQQGAYRQTLAVAVADALGSPTADPLTLRPDPHRSTNDIASLRILP